MLEIIDHPLTHDGSLDVGQIRELKIARPPVNALNTELLRKIVEAVQGAAPASALVITGQPGVFSAGLDVRGMLELDRDGVAATFVELWRAGRAIACSTMPVVFGLTGHSPAGGTVLAIHGDYRILASGEFRMGLNEVHVGLFPGPVIHGAFRRLVGGHAAQLLTRGALIDPATALRVGLVDELCEPARVAARALELAREMSALPREAMVKTREMVRRDLVELFGNPSHALLAEREFGAMAVEKWLVPATQERLRKVFAKK
ncbi:MAG: enoyl-CoA hydratase/isomerase family protein [Steroidobacteraceae bacterium]|nr:enoyl-CoA hydratase/isomerase family protein [Steroidobacteraceae bacterium]